MCTSSTLFRPKSVDNSFPIVPCESVSLGTTELLNQTFSNQRYLVHHGQKNICILSTSQVFSYFMLRKLMPAFLTHLVNQSFDRCTCQDQSQGLDAS